MTAYKRYAGSAIAAILLLSGCATTPSTQFYTLSAQSKPGTPVPQAKKLVVGIGPIAIPALLDRRQLVTRGPNNTVFMNELQQWAAPLNESMTEVLSQNLITLLPNNLFRPYPWTAYTDVQYRLLLDVLRFDTSVEKIAYLEVNWAIMAEKNHTILSSGHTALHKPAGSSDADSVTALSALLAEFAQRLSTELQTIAVGQLSH